MALSALSGDEQGILFVQLCNVLDPGIAVALSSVSNELRTATQAPLPQLKADHEAAAALCLKLGHQSCKELREAKKVATFAKVRGARWDPRCLGSWRPGAYRRGTDFSAAVVAALGPRRALIAQGRWRQLFKEPGCPDLAAYLAARYDSLMVGLRRWGCELATVDGIPALNAYGHRVQLETTDVHAANLASPAEKKDMWTRASTPLAEKLQRLDAWLASLSTK